MTDRPLRVVASGHFNPIHASHLAYLDAAADLGVLTVIVNSDRQAVLKKGFTFFTEDQRMSLVGSLARVRAAVLAIDDDLSVCRTLEWLHSLQPIDVFANGGDVGAEGSCREATVCRRLGIEMVFGVGGPKGLSSSRMVEEAVARARAAGV